MPLYEYRCKQCGHQFEKIQSFSAPDEKECPVCKGEVERLISAPAIQFKGSGWYVTDYSGKGGAKAAAASASSGGDSGEGKTPGSGTSGAEAEAKPAASSSPASALTSTTKSD